MIKFVAAAVGAAMMAAGPSAQGDMHAPFDRILDTYVRDGRVYYRALRKERASLDRYVASLDVPAATLAEWPREARGAFWINAYNALVLRTVVDAYPIRGKSADYPPDSIRQVSGAFERHKHRVGGQSLTLDEIETTKIAEFGDARLLLALGRGALGGGRLRSEAFTAAALETQLTQAVKECAARISCVRLDPSGNVLEVTPLVGWREELFVKSFGADAGKWSNRAPIERAIATMIFPHLFQSEQEFLLQNTFGMRYGQFDWRLNEL